MKTTITKKDLPQLITDLKAAKVAAQEAIQGRKDEGSCNFDAPAMKVGRFTQNVKKALTSAGIGYYSELHHGYVVLQIGVGMQASTRTEGARAFSKHMKDLGYVMSMHYAVD